MNIKQISLIEPRPKRKNMWSTVIQPRVGSVLLATILKRLGYKVKVFSEAISPINWTYVSQSDLCGISCFSSIAKESYEISEKIRKMGIPVVMGGPHPTILPEETLGYCNYVVRREGEETFPALLKILKNDGNLESVRGISFKKEGRVIHTLLPDRLIDLNELPSPDFSLIDGYENQPEFKSFFKLLFDPHIRTGIHLTSRGCPERCTFCDKQFGTIYRRRDVEKVIEDIKKCVAVRRPPTIYLADDNFGADQRRAEKFLEEYKKSKIDIPLSVMIRADSAANERFVRNMSEAGVYLVFIGFESIVQDTLDRDYNKRLKLDQIIQAINNLKKYGINIHGMFIVGADSDPPDIVEKTLDFGLSKKLETIQIHPLSALPGTKLTEKLKKEKRLINVPWSSYDLQHVNILPKNFRPSVLQRKIFDAYKKFYSFARVTKLIKRGGLDNYSSYCTLFGSIALRTELPHFKKYIKFLEQQEKGKYKGNSLII